MSTEIPGSEPINNTSYQGQAYDTNAQPIYTEQTPHNVSDEDRTWAMLAHLSSVIATFISAGWLSFVGPLLVWFLKKDSSPYVRSAAAQSFNFNLSMWIASVAGWICIITFVLLPLGVIICLAAFVLTLWHHIRATVAASKSLPYTYPWQIKVLN